MTCLLLIRQTKHTLSLLTNCLCGNWLRYCYSPLFTKGFHLNASHGKNSWFFSFAYNVFAFRSQCWTCHTLVSASTNNSIQFSSEISCLKCSKHILPGECMRLPMGWDSNHNILNESWFIMNHEQMIICWAHRSMHVKWVTHSPFKCKRQFDNFPKKLIYWNVESGERIVSSHFAV